MKLPMEQVIEACDHIKELNPKPGSGFDARGHLKYITPDVTVVKLANYYEILLDVYKRQISCLSFLVTGRLADSGMEPLKRR